MPQPSSTAELPLPRRSRTWTIAIGLALLCFAVRIPALLALPIFGDEAIYLRWAQLIRHGHLWVSLCDPKPPLHFWMIATVMKFTADPLLAARLLSVFAGAIAIPLILGLCNELAALARPATSGRLVGILAAVLAIFCPFLAFYQRLATADAIFIPEMLAAIFISLRWARLLSQNQNGWPTAILLGISLGVALLTRQGLSYTLCAIPAAALLVWLLKNRDHPAAPPSPRFFINTAMQLSLAALLAAVLWSPYLFANLKADAANKDLTPFADLKSRILYQSDFTNSKESHLQVAQRNFAKTFIPDYRSDTGETLKLPTHGWFFFYLTPPIFIAALLGMIYLISRKNLLIFMFLAAWIALMLGPPIFLGNVIYSRYVLAAVPPLLIAIAFLLADVLGWILSRRAHPAILWLFAVAILGGLLLAPLLQVAAQFKKPQDQTLTQQDRYQYLSGGSAAGPVAQAIAALTRDAANGPIVVITDAAWGNPADAVWVYLSNNPNITLYYNIPSVDGPLILTPASPETPNTYLLRKNKFLFTRPEPVTIPADVPAFLIVNDPTGDMPAEIHFRKNNPNLGAPIPFYGVDGAAGSDHVVIFPVH